jgi:flagellar biosynthesis protein FlhB
MAENEEGEEKTERPTSKRVRDARKKGDVPRSRELDTTVMLLAASGGLLLLGGGIGQKLMHMMAADFRIDRKVIFDNDAILSAFGGSLIDMLWLLAPFLVVTVIAALATPTIMGGWNVSFEKLTPNFGKLNPVSGMKRFVSVSGLAELVKGVGKVILIGGMGWLMINHRLPEVMGLGNQDVGSALVETFQLLGWVFLALSAATIPLAAVDAPFQLWSYHRKLRMTKQEIKEEGKETEGSPETKSRVRRIQQEQAMRRMMSEIPKADVVVTNPTHFAVALRYDEEGMRAPKVVAKGADMVAAQIRAIAKEHQVPMFAAPPLARALYFNCQLDREIPAGLYLAVAQVLAYVYQLRAAIHGGYPEPPPPAPEVPDEYFHGP